MSSYQTRKRKFQKHSTKIQKFKKRHYGFSSSQNKLGKAKKEKKKKIIPMSFYATRDRKFQKNSKKIEKPKNHHFGNFSSQNKLGNAEKEGKKKKSFQ